MMISGYDEVARCKVIGNIITAYVVVDDDFFIKNKKLRIKDSKVLTENRIKQIFNLTKDLVKFYKISYITPQEMMGDNINKLEMKKLLEAIKESEEKGLKSDKIFVNNFEVNEVVFKNRFLELNQNLELYNRIKLSHHSKEKAIYLASIYARYFELLENEEIRKKFGDFGSGSPADKNTREFILKNKDTDIVRKSYKTYKDLCNKTFLN